MVLVNGYINMLELPHLSLPTPIPVVLLPMSQPQSQSSSCPPSRAGSNLEAAPAGDTPHPKCVRASTVIWPKSTLPNVSALPETIDVVMMEDELSAADDVAVWIGAIQSYWSHMTAGDWMEMATVLGSLL